MAVAGLTLETIIARVARNILGADFHNSTASANGDTTSLIDNTLRGGDDEFIGKWIYMTSGDNDGKETRVDDYAETGTDMTLAPALSSATTAADSYMLFDRRYSATAIKDAINQAITDVAGRVYRYEESFALFADGVTTRFDLPSEMDMVNRIKFRSYVPTTVVHNCDSTFDETTDTGFGQELDTEDKKRGQSLKITVDATLATVGEFVTAAISSIDISGKTHLEGWVKSTVALTANDYVIHLDSGVVQADGTDLESLNVPAVSADTWTYFRIALANPETDTAIVSIGLEMNVDKGAHTVWFDDIKAVNHDAAQWTPVGKNLWNIDREENDLYFSPAGVRGLGYGMLKLEGGSIPASMTANSDVATVPEQYLIAQATAYLLYGGSVASNEDPDGRRSLADRFQQQANRARGGFDVLTSVRKV